MVSRLSFLQLEVFLSTFLCVLSLHAARESWYMVKHYVRGDLGFSSTVLGAIDSTYLLFYSLGYYASGVAGEYFPVTRLVGGGMMCAAVLYVAIGMMCMMRFTSVPIYLFLWALQGPSQGTDLTGCVAIIANWFPPSSRGRVMGLWGGNQSVGNIVGELVAALIVDFLGLSWEWIVILPAILVAGTAAYLLARIYDSPQKRQRDYRGSVFEPLIERKGDELIPSTPLSFWACWRLPGVAFCASSYACVKLLNYGMRMWMPFYLEFTFHFSLTRLAVFLTTYNIGGIVGSAMGGWLSDVLCGRLATVGGMLVCSVPVMILFRTVASGSEALLYIYIPLLGATIGGVANLMSTAVAADLSQSPKNGPSRPSVIGIVNGTGSFGAASGQIIIGWLSSDWDHVFVFLICIAGIGVILLLPMIWREAKKTKIKEIASAPQSSDSDSA